MSRITGPYVVLASQAAILGAVGTYALISPFDFAKRNGGMIGAEGQFDEGLVCTFGLLAVSLSATYFVCASSERATQRRAMRTNVALRLLGTLCFWRIRMAGTAIYELVWAAVNAGTASSMKM